MAEVSNDSKLFAVIAYLFGIIGGILVYLLKKDDKFARFHGMQSILLSIVGMVVAIFTLGLGWILVLLVVLFMIWKSWNGEKYKLPVLGDYAEKYSA